MFDQQILFLYSQSNKLMMIIKNWFFKISDYHLFFSWMLNEKWEWSIIDHIVKSFLFFECLQYDCNGEEEV